MKIIPYVWTVFLCQGVAAPNIPLFKKGVVLVWFNLVITMAVADRWGHGHDATLKENYHLNDHSRTNKSTEVYKVNRVV